jgi:hypothetical protein
MVPRDLQLDIHPKVPPVEHPEVALDDFLSDIEVAHVP